MVTVFFEHQATTSPFAAPPIVLLLDFTRPSPVQPAPADKADDKRWRVYKLSRINRLKITVFVRAISERPRTECTPKRQLGP